MGPLMDRYGKIYFQHSFSPSKSPIRANLAKPPAMLDEPWAICITFYKRVGASIGYCRALLWMLPMIFLMYL